MFKFQFSCRFSSVATAMTTAIGLMAIAGTASAATVLSYSPWLPATFIHEKTVNAWTKRVEQVTEGRVKVVYRAAAVGAPNVQFDVVRDGMADISLVLPGYTPGRFPLMEMAELPFMSTDPEYSAPSFYRHYIRHFASLQPYRNTHVLSTWLIQAQQIVTTDRVIKNMDDLKGLKLRSPNPQSTATISALGAVPVSAPGAELYQMAASGVVDGAYFNYEPMLSFNIHPYFKFFTVVPGGMTSSSFALLINEKKWNSLSERDRKAISEIAGEALAAEVGKAVAAGEVDAEEQLKKLGVTFVDMEPALLAQVTEKVKPVDQAWIDSARKAGLQDPEKVLADFRAEQRAAIGR